MAGMVDDYESSDLAERHKVALRLADAMMSQPGSIRPQLRSDGHEHFSDQEILELTLDVMKWNTRRWLSRWGSTPRWHPGS
jgi:alkylhydroperoxidase family enzyme